MQSDLWSDLWTARYRPETFEQFVWVDQDAKKTVENWLRPDEKGIRRIPHILLTGRPGTGKTSLIGILLRMLDIPEQDIKRINGSGDRQVNVLQAEIASFTPLIPTNPSKMKYIVINECDRLSPHSQDLLRADMEDNERITRYLMTANRPERLTDALKSRTQHLHFPTLDRDAFTLRVADVLIAQHVQGDFIDTMLHYVDRYYPDMRKCINELQRNTIDNVLRPLTNKTTDVGDHIYAVVELFKTGRIWEARKVICDKIQLEEYDDFYRMLYQNLEWFGTTDDQQAQAVTIIAEALFRHEKIADKEINLAACLAELSRI